MARIASFHLVSEPRHRIPLVLARLGTDRVALSRVPGLRFWRLLGTGAGDDTAPSADLARSAMFAIWDDEAAFERFVGHSPIARRWQRATEAWQVRLRGIGGHGTWRGTDVLEGLEPAQHDGPLAIITRADVRRSARRAFSGAGGPVSDEVRSAAGLLGVVGIGETPRSRLGTFSLWRSADDVRRFVGQPHHREVIRRTRDERWYGEEMFARFEPYAASGTWDGRDPLAAGPLV
jgi:heme-degrading monooxygenase HmoA